MLPPGILTMEGAVQRAIAYHELLHVRRRDWLDALVEEAIRTIFWFHPGVWWLIGRIQLSREQVVDQAAIELTESRERYVEALLAVAMTQSRISFMPAAPFLRRRLLKKRVDQILQETTMSTPRLIASLTVSAAALALVTAGAIRSFPRRCGQAGRNSQGGLRRRARSHPDRQGRRASDARRIARVSSRRDRTAHRRRGGPRRDGRSKGRGVRRARVERPG
jgi:hypothetical protein